MSAKEEVGLVLKTVDIVFDGPPGPEGPRFVEVEDMKGAGVRVGEWMDRGNGLWALRVKVVTYRAALGGEDG